jgi:two-component system, cell cycle sensor histidine kinase and response regulator CckA
MHHAFSPDDDLPALRLDDDRHREAAATIARLHAVLRNATDLVSINDAQGVVQYISPSVTRILGYQPEDLIGRSSFDFLHPDDLAAIASGFRAASGSPGVNPTVQMRFRHAGGEWRTLEATSTNLLDDPHVRGVVVNARDITEQRAHERQLRFQASALEQMSDAMIVVDDSYAVTYLNPAAERLYGQSFAVARGRFLGELFRVVYEHPGDEQEAWRSMREQGLWRGECRHVCAARTIAVEVAVVALRGEEASGMVAVVRDVTARKQAEERLRLLESVVVNAHDAVIITEAAALAEPSPRILYVNEAFTAITGYSAAAAVGRSPRFLQGSDTSRETTAQIRVALERREPVRVEIRNYTRAGRPIWIDLSIAPVTSADGQVSHFVAIMRDVTLRKDLEAQLLQAQKLESIGRLAGGIAHDFNNLLTAIGGYADLALDGVGAAPAREDIAEIRRGVDRASALTRQLLAFSRRHAHSPEVLALNDVVAQIEKLLHRLIGPTIDLRAALTPDPTFVAADPVQIEQVLVNLAVNARDAMPHGGVLRISTSVVAREPHALLPRPDDTATALVRLQVCDSGAGMAPEVLEHLFEPFFTTKPAGQGTGLGLATCYGIVHQHGGRIYVESQPGVGTTVTVELPSCAAPAAADAPSLQHALAPEGRELLLVVDDEPGIRALMCRVLEGAGYSVLLAADGAEAAAALRSERGATVQLVVSDVLMPVMDGYQLDSWMRAQGLRVPLLYTSGHAMPDDGAGPLRSLLAKPFTADALLRAVRGAIDSQGWAAAAPGR